MDKFTIYGRLDGLNDYTLANRRNRYAGATMKRKNEELVQYAINTQIPAARYSGKVRLHFSWYEPNKKRDKDNICFAKKFILDALVREGTISADNWSGIDGFTDDFYIDKEQPRIEVEITEALNE